MKLTYNKGICLNDSIVLDKQTAKNHEFNVISHAHSDHVNLAGKSRVIATPETIALIKANYSKKFDLTALPYKKKLKLDDITISFHNAGHMLGSAQTLIEEPNETILYTGDFKLQDSLTEKKAEILNADTLIIDSTYGFPAYNFPEREKVYNKMTFHINNLIEKNYFIILSGYAFGKSQELTAFANTYLNEIPLVHEKIFENNKIYETFKESLGKYEKLNHNFSNHNILIMPPSLVNNHLIQALEFSLKKKISTVFVSGWNFHSFNKCFPLSDHASFKQLIDFVSMVKPKKVYTLYGFTSELANAIRRRLKIPARPFFHGKNLKSNTNNKKQQSFLVEF